MGSTASQNQKRQASAQTERRLTNPSVLGATTFSSITTSMSAASLSCLAAEHGQIHDQEALDLWKNKALETINDLFEQKADLLRHEAQMRAVLGQLRAIINEELPRRAMLVDQRVQCIDMPMNHRQE